MDPAMDGVTGASRTRDAGEADQVEPMDEDGVDLQSLARGGVFALFGSAVAAVLGFMLTVLLTRNVDAVTVGVVFTIVLGLPDRLHGRPARVPRRVRSTSWPGCRRWVSPTGCARSCARR